MVFNKKFMTGVAFATLMTGLAACSGGEEEAKEGGSEKITIFQTKVEISDQLEAAAETYTEETGVEVEVIGTTGDDYFQQLQIRLNNGTGPSIMSLQNSTVAKRVESYVYDLSGEEFVKDIAPNMALMVDDKLVGIPYGVEGFGLVYNKDLVNPEDIQDYESFNSTLEKFKSEDINGLGLSSEAYFLIGHISNYPFSLQEDPEAFMDSLTSGEATMAETEEFLEFGKFMESIRANTPSPLGVSYDQQVGDFAAGKTAMIHQGNWASSLLNDFDVDFEVGMAPFPLEGNDKLAVGVGSNWAVNSEKEQEEIDAAIDFLEWLHTSETGKQIIVEEFGFIPAMTNIEANDLDPLSTAVFEASNNGETIPWSHNYYPANLVPNDFAPATEEFFANEKVTGDEFISNLDAAWQNATK
ncbi:sugar ABC transporter substrate-binding protein [Planococcus donghaensis]|uniref:ABC transporter substrate-binding protein n=1 Tax=Planococcus donghaensis TaxID=414778 RepID=A0A1C7EDI7_9BACL|nr:extracellular solute-binding protein [Planococcus donghaensis]ANU22034.1 ABC transporter substrate-binding protein [Planococcus donghaensis]